MWLQNLLQNFSKTRYVDHGDKLFEESLKFISRNVVKIFLCE